MAIQKRFIHFKKFSDFNSKKLSANEANTQYTVGVSGAIQDGEPDILYQSYVWIKDTKQQWTHAQLYGNDSTVDLTYEELKSLRDNSQLVPGQQYRITDYVTTTSQENTRSAGHQFDIIVTADNENTLNEVARACLHEGDIYFSWAGANLAAWKIWYSLDNDAERFAWAISADKPQVICHSTDSRFPAELDERTIEPVVSTEDVYLYDSKVLYLYDLADGSQVYFCENGSIINEVDVNVGYYEAVMGKGVIYRMIDEHNNDIPYDFKNIQFFHNDVDFDNKTENAYIYTFTWTNDDVLDASIYGYEGMLSSQIYHHNGVNNNKMGPASNPDGIQHLNNNIFLYVGNTGDFSGIYNNSFGDNCINNSFNRNCNNNSFGNNCDNNNLGNDFVNNNFGDSCDSNSFGNSCKYNSFASGCTSNSLGNSCQYNSFGVSCNNNNLGISGTHNSFGNNCYGNSFGHNCGFNSFGNYCRYNSFSGANYDNSFGNRCEYNTFLHYCNHNSFGNYCRYNSFGENCYNNSFGNACLYNSFRLSASVTGTLLNYCYNNHFDDGCSYNVIWNSVQPTESNKLQNINVNRGVSGTAILSCNFINIDTFNSGQEINVNQVDGIVSIGEVLSIRYKSLKALRDSSQLIPGRQYRIIDYNTTTSQPDTASAKHQFDIIVTAINEFTLSEEVQAIQNINDIYFNDSNLSAWKLWYCLDNDTSRFAWASEEITTSEEVEVTIYDSSECTIKPELIDGNTFITPFNFESCVWVDARGDNEAYTDENNHDIAEMVYEWDYFDNPKTGNTELCIYKSDAGLYEEEGCADSGDKYVYRGLVTIDGEEYDYWQKYETNQDGEYNELTVAGEGYVFATTPRIVANPEACSYETTTKIVETVIPLEPKGVIYYMKDEFSNEAPYDFKNIQFKRCKVTSDLEGADLTTLAQEYVGYPLSGYGASMPFHISLVDTSDYKYVYTFSGINNGSIVDASLGTSGIACYDNSMKLYIASNVQYLNDIVMYAHPESGNHCITKNTFASDCFSMTLGCEQVGEVWDNHFGQYCKNNIIVGPYVYQNDFGANLTACYFSKQISQNQIGSYMQRNFVNNTFVQNVLGPNCKDNIFMKKCSLNTIGEQFMNNTCNDEFYQNNLGAGFLENTFNGKFYSNVSYNQFMRNTINGQCSCCDFGTQCTGNTLGIFRNSKTGSLFMSNVLCDTMACVFGIGFNCNNVTATKMQCSTFGTYAMYNNWTSSGTVKNIKVSDYLQGTTSSYNNIELPADSVCEVKVAKNSSGDIKIYCEADLIS